MNEPEAAALAQFVKDHDKRFTAAVQTSGGDFSVLFTRADDGAELPPVRTPDEYRRTHIEQNDPSPTVRAAKGKWQPRNDADSPNSAADEMEQG